jgi:hypothetical protein
MFGCLRRLGCLVILVIAALGYYWYTHRTGHGGATAGTEGAAAIWTTITPADAEHGRQAVATLRAGSGRVFANLTPAEAVAYLIQTAAKQLPPTAEDVQAMIVADTLRVRAVLPLQSLGAAKVLGPLASLLSNRDSVQLSGTVDVIRPGLAQFRVTDVMIRSLAIPHVIIPKFVAQLRHTSPEGLASNGLALPLPPYIADIRIANGKVTLYKNV